MRTNDWMETHDFPDDTKVRRFCLTLSGEARLWYETLRAAQLVSAALQECFQHQYSKFGRTREQYFHVWRSFHYDEKTDTINSYIGRVKQVTGFVKLWRTTNLRALRIPYPVDCIICYIK